MPTSKDFTYTRALFNLFRNVMNYRKLRECRLQISHVFVIYRHETHSRIILCTCSLENNAFSVLHYVKKVTLHYLMLHRFEIHSALELSRKDLLCCCLARSLASSGGCSLAINFWKQSQFFWHYTCSTSHLSICAEELFNVWLLCTDLNCE